MKIYRIVLTVVAFCLLCTSVVTLSMGWLTNVWSALPEDQKLPFSAGNTADYKFYRYSFNKDGTLNTANSSAFDGEGTDSIGTPVEDENGDPFALNVNDLQFGTLTNLYFLESDNVVFYAVKIPASMGTVVNAAISYGAYDASGNLSVTFGNHFKIYDKDGTTEYTDDTVVNMTAIRALETKYGGTFVSYSCVTSATAPTSSMKFDDLNGLFSDAQVHPVATLTKESGATTYTPAPAAEQTYNAPTGTTTDYYLYIKLQPNMEMYKYFIDYLYAHMPFYLSYQVGIQLSVNPATNSASE